MRTSLLVVLFIAFHFHSYAMLGQQAAAEPVWLSSLTPPQRVLFEDARKSFAVQNYKSALPKLRQIHGEAPQNVVITKFTAEAAVNTGEFALASTLLEPVLQANADDPEALGIQAHLFGQQHDVARRDATLDHIQKLHDAGKPAPSVVVTETVALPEGNTVRIDNYIEPYSRFHIVLMAIFFDKNGQRDGRIALESDDIDQVSFKKDHPDQTANGVRIYSLDSYGEQRNAEGKVTGQTHGTLCAVPGCFMTGRPTYEFFRTFVLNRAKAAPISSTTTTPTPERK